MIFSINPLDYIPIKYGHAVVRYCHYQARYEKDGNEVKEMREFDILEAIFNSEYDAVRWAAKQQEEQKESHKHVAHHLVIYTVIEL